MTHRDRPRVHFVTGGPSPDERRARFALTPRKKLPKIQRDALNQIDASLKAIRVALRHEDLPLARELRRVAWKVVDTLPTHLTREQRRDLWHANRELLILQEALRRRGSR
jgi:hypothetical protein